MADKDNVRVYARARGGGNSNVEVTGVSTNTEIRIPWLGWLSMMVLGPMLVSLVWLLGWIMWLYDAKQAGHRFYWWSKNAFTPWWESGGDLLYLASLVVIAIVPTGITMYRFFTETGTKVWDARDGAWYPGKKVPREERGY